MIPDLAVTAHDDVPSDLKLLLKTLRGVLKAKKYTYARLAGELGVSEVSVKRWLGGKSCSSGRLFEICDKIGVSFFDLAALARQDEEEDFFLTPEQESFFARKPALFGLFKELYRGETVQEISKAWELDGPRMYRALRSLEKLGLLEVGPSNRIRISVRGNLRAQHRGPLAKAVLRPQILRFLDHVDRVLEQDDVCLHSAEVELSAAHVTELVAEIHALGAKYRNRALRDRSLLPKGKTKPVRWLLAFAPYRTDWRQYGL